MSEDNEKALPKDSDSDYSLPGRLEESNSEYFEIQPSESKSRSRTILILAAVFVIVSSGFFSYYFINQDDIDSRIIQNMNSVDPERSLANQYGVGEYGSDHAHAAIAVFVDGEQVNFGLRQFQLSSKYIHFEDHNPYMIHKHATGVPLDMLFVSLGLKITTECIMMSHGESSSKSKINSFCEDKDNPLLFYLNGEKYRADISQYVIEHGDRILISYGDTKSIPKYLAYLESLEISDVPKKTPRYSENEIFV